MASAEPTGDGIGNNPEADPIALALDINRLEQELLMMASRPNKTELALQTKMLERIGLKMEERELALERRRIKEVVRQQEERFPPVVEDCPICLEPVRADLNSGVTRLVCCGQFVCKACSRPDKIHICPLCRADFPSTAQEVLNATKLLAENGVAWATCEIAQRLECGGRGLEVDKQQAFAWYRLAAERGNPHAMYRLGEMHLSGESGIVTKSVPEGIYWLKAAADKGHIDAQLELGTELYNGGNVPEDKVEAVRIFTLAISNDSDINETVSAVSAFHFAASFEDGSGGLKRSLEMAKYYYTKGIATLPDNVPKKGMVQLLLAKVIGELSEVRYGYGYVDRDIFPGHSHIPRVLNLARKALENGEPDAAQMIDSIETQQRDYCSACKREAAVLVPLKLKSCMRCKAVWYCGKECQRKDWNDGHKRDCCPGDL